MNIFLNTEQYSHIQVKSNKNKCIFVFIFLFFYPPRQQPRGISVFSNKNTYCRYSWI